MRGLGPKYLGRMEAIGHWGLLSPASMFRDHHDCRFSVINRGRGWKPGGVGGEAVFAAVRAPRGARWGDCQEPGTRRDGKTWSVLVFNSYLSGNFRK